MTIRKEKEKEFFIQHMDTFRVLGLADPFFTIKTAFFQKGKFGRQVQFFEWELSKGEDIYIEFYDYDKSGVETDVVPANPDRQLFKYKHNPFFAEEYEQKENTNAKGEPYFTYIVPASELIAVLKNGTEITQALYEKRKQDVGKEVDALPNLQKTVSSFPDFTEEYGIKSTTMALPDEETSLEDINISAMTVRDFCAIVWEKPVSNKPWLNQLIEKQ